MFAAFNESISSRNSPAAREANTAGTHGTCDSPDRVSKDNTSSVRPPLGSAGLLHVYDSYIQSLKTENRTLKNEISHQSHRVTSLRELFHEFRGHSPPILDGDNRVPSEQQQQEVEGTDSGKQGHNTTSSSSSSSSYSPHSFHTERFHRHNTPATSTGLHCDIGHIRKRLLEFERQSRQDQLALDQLTEHMRDFKLELMPTVNRTLEHTILEQDHPGLLSSPRMQDGEIAAGALGGLSRNIDELGREWRIVKALMTARTESNELIRRQIMASNLDLQHRLNQLHRSLRRSESDSAEKESLNSEESRHMYAEIRRLQEQLQRELEEYESHIRALQEDLQTRDQTIDDARQQMQQMRDQLEQDARERADMHERAQKEVDARLRLEQEVKMEQRRSKELQLQLDMLKMGQLEGPLSHRQQQQHGDVSRVVDAMNQLMRDNEELKKLLAEQGVYIRRFRASAALAGLSGDAVNGSRNDIVTASSFTDTSSQWPHHRLLTQSAASVDGRSRNKAQDPAVCPILLDREVEMVAEGRLSETVLMARLIEGGAASATRRDLTK